MKAKVLVRKHYPAAWVFNFPPIEPGAVVPVVEATNLPKHRAGLQFWVNTPELEDDAYGILLSPGEYELVDEAPTPQA